jgi:hypothetical protein
LFAFVLFSPPPLPQRQENAENGAVVEREEAEYKGSDGIGEKIIGEEAR